MSSNTQYQTIPARKTIICREKCGGCLALASGMLLFLSFISGMPIVVSYGLEYHKVDSFSTQPSYCRVNAIGRHGRLSFKGVHSGYVDWNVDIVKQPQDNNASNHLVVLRRNVTALAFYDTERQYSVDKVYQCYVHKKIVD
ncbi:unnamed protein product [Rotaria magnacalcarata]|uniref:Uncharacterized protein n=1 Tax=Rotaria magnacalcarata TaxID=392030 RepID=A0A816H8W2_9BILA|nr:unnamed protein product [Rotaria magnacalcarata]CAF1683847.1 unnamed protein product [Rotaria magnacalcarata]